MAIDWCEAARLVAAGQPSRDIVARIGCSRSQLYRRRTRCPLFQALVAAHVEVSAPAGGGAIPVPAAAPGTAAASIEAKVRRQVESEVADGNLKVALWLAERLRLFTPDGESSAEETIRRLMDSMTPLERAAFSRPE